VRWLQGDYLVVILLLPFLGLLGGNQLALLLSPLLPFAYNPILRAFTAVIQVMVSKYLAALKKADLNAVEAKIQETPMIYRRMERLCGDMTPLWKKLEDYGSAVSAYLSLKKAASLCHHLIVVRQQKRPYVPRTLSLPSPILLGSIQNLMHYKRDIGASSRGSLSWRRHFVVLRQRSVS